MNANANPRNIDDFSILFPDLTIREYILTTLKADGAKTVFVVTMEDGEVCYVADTLDAAFQAAADSVDCGSGTHADYGITCPSCTEAK